MWKCYALLSAFFAALTAIFAKVGVRDINSDLATAIRTTVVLFIAWGVVLFGSHVGEIRDLSTELGHWPTSSLRRRAYAAFRGAGRSTVGTTLPL